MTLPSWLFAPLTVAWLCAAISWVAWAIMFATHVLYRRRMDRFLFSLRDHSDRFNSELTPETRQKLSVRFLEEMRRIRRQKR